MKRVVPFLALLACGAAAAANNPCAGLTHCRVDGSLRSQVTRVVVTDGGPSWRVHGVRTTVRLTNLGTTPLILAYVNDSAQITDDKGLIYKREPKVMGIGITDKSNADPQFQLAAGETREFQVDQGLFYYPTRTIVGTRYDQTLTIAQLRVLSEQSIRTQREYPLDFPNLAATDGVGAVAAANGSTAASGTAGTAGLASPAAVVDACAGQQACQAQGPIAVQITNVRMTDGGNSWHARSAYFTVRVRNVSAEPLILGLRAYSVNVTDDHGVVYNQDPTWQGIGLVSKSGADTQLQLAAGQSREFQLEKGLHYWPNKVVPGPQLTLDFALVRMAIVGPQQVQSLSDYALSFPGLTAGNSYGGSGGVASADGSTATSATGDGSTEAADKVNNATKVGEAVKGFLGLFKDGK